MKIIRRAYEEALLSFGADNIGNFIVCPMVSQLLKTFLTW